MYIIFSLMLTLFFIILFFVFYIINQRDIYFSYGKAVVLKYELKAVITYDQYGGVKFTLPNGSCEYLIGYLGQGTLKILKANGIVTSDNFESADF